LIFNHAVLITSKKRPHNNKVHSSIMVDIVKRCFSKILSSTGRLMGLFTFGWQLPGFSASSSLLEVSAFSGQRSFIILALSLLLIFLLLHYRKNRYGLSSLLGKQYTYLEVSKSKQQIGLYRRHQTNTDTVLNISDVLSSKVMLNDKLISLVTQEQADTFTVEQEKRLLANFTRIQNERMHDGQLRKVNLVLTDKQQKNYVICLYLRAGNKRLTQTRYRDVVEDVLDWCRLLSSQINTYHSHTTQAHAPAETAPAPVKAAQEQEKTIAQPKAQSQSQSQSDRDEFIAALEKLAKMKLDGLLTESEFTRAKAKLLNTPEK